MFAHDHVGFVIELRQQFCAMIQFGFAAHLCEISAKHHEIRLGLQQVGFGNRGNQAAIPVSDKLVALDMLDM